MRVIVSVIIASRFSGSANTHDVARHESDIPDASTIFRSLVLSASDADTSMLFACFEWLISKIKEYRGREQAAAFAKKYIRP